MRLFNSNQSWHRSLREAVAKLEAGDSSCLYITCCALGMGDKELIRDSGRACRRVLERYDMQRMIRLSETFRQYTSLDWVIDWEQICPTDFKHAFESEADYRYMLILGSFHPNGYYRERCVREMADAPGTLPYLLLRMNDWVGKIRDTAAEAVCRRIDGCDIHELFFSARALEKVRDSGRRSSQMQSRVEQKIELRMVREGGGICAETVLKYDYGVRKSIYRFLLSRKLLDLGTAQRLLTRERHSFCQMLIITELLRSYPCTPEQVDQFLCHPSACVRRKTLDYKYRIIKNSWQGLETMLLDPSRSVRELAAFILEHHSTFDVPGFYVSHLTDENPSAAITGLGERGGREMAALLPPFLTHPSDRTVCCTVTALGRLEGPEGEAVFWKYLFDSRAAVSKASFRAAAGSGVRYGAGPLYEALLRSSIPHVTRYVLYLLLRENSWERLPYLLLLWQKPGLEIYRDKIMGGIGCRNMYAAVPADRASLIRRTLACEGSGLPEWVSTEILFDLKFVEKP